MLPLTEVSGQQNGLTSKESGTWLMRGRSLGWPRISGLGDLVGVWRCQSARWRECEEGDCVREAPCHGDLTSKERCPVDPGGCGPGAPWGALGGADRSGVTSVDGGESHGLLPEEGLERRAGRKGGGAPRQGRGALSGVSLAS